MLLRRWFVAVYYCSTYYEHMYGFVCVLHLRARSVCDRTPAKCNGCHHINDKCISLIALAVLDTAQQRSMLGVLGVWFPQSFAVSSSSMHVRSVPIGSVLSFITNITFAYTTTTYLCYVWCVCVQHALRSCRGLSANITCWPDTHCCHRKLPTCIGHERRVALLVVSVSVSTLIIATIDICHVRVKR